MTWLSSVLAAAAGQHLCRVADALQMRRILDHPHASVLSAVGMGLAPIGRVVTHGVYHPLDASCRTVIDEIAQQLRGQASEQLRGEESAGSQHPHFQFECDVRYAGTESALLAANVARRNPCRSFP